MRRLSEGLRKDVHWREPANRPENLYSFDDPNASLGQDWSFMGLSSRADCLLILPKQSRNVLERVSRSSKVVVSRILTKRNQCLSSRIANPVRFSYRC